MGAVSSGSRVGCQPLSRNIACGCSLNPVKLKEAEMPNPPIDPAATPEDPDAPEIAASDAGASAAAERASKAANDDLADDDR